ncbi:MAG: hypothetical protein CMN30_17380 [Sandaracinus sp.]|nr:hypothetical protein [Sandaracinus sp.]|tara:strand:+ start:1818 stop:2162 length:345 start_codon:yes stop_codon:yes gene_type:complete
MTSTYIHIAKNYSPRLGGRYVRDGKFSGEDFRDRVLRPAFLANDKVSMNIDGTENISASFYEEALGGLVAEFGLKAVLEKLTIVAVERGYLVPRLLRWMEQREAQRVAKTAANA